MLKINIMNIYFTTSVKSSIEKGEEISNILNLLRSNNQVELRPKLKSAMDIDNNKVNLQNSVGLEFLQQGSTIQDVFLASQKRITRSDIVIAEMTYESTGLGYDVAQASLQSKPVLVLLDSKLSKVGNNPIFGSDSNRISVKNYTPQTLETIIEEFLISARRQLDSKFILIIPAEIERYLSWASTKRGIRKAEIVRNAVDDLMEKDKEYHEYLKNLIK